MSLLSFRTPVLYAACHRCGNALTHGEEECPHCGTNQSRALRAPNSVDFNNSNVLMMPGRMLVPYPSVPEEVDTAMNIARERARIVKRVAFYLASGGLLAVALGLTHAPGLRSPVVQRLSALPEPAKAPAFIPVTTDNTANATAPASATAVAGADSTRSTTVQDPTAKTIAKNATTVIAAANPPSVANTPNTLNTSIATSASKGAPVTTAAHSANLPSVTNAPNAPNATTASKATTVIAAVNLPAPATVKNPSNANTATIASKAATVTNPTPPAFIVNAPGPTTSTTANKAATLPAAAIATNPTTPTTAPLASKPAAIVATANSKSTPTTPVAPIPATSTKLAGSTPSPTATADVPIASHAPQPSALTENGLPRLSLTPISPAMASERPPAGSPGETLYIARLALITNDLSAAHKNLADVPANLSNDAEAKRIREELAQREAARDAAMQHARACDATASWRCARRYAKEAIAIDSSYADSRVLLKRVTFKAAEAKKAADAAALQAAANAQRVAIHAAPIREAVPVPRVVTASASVAAAPASNTSNSAPHLFATPAAPVRAPRESRVIHEARETRPVPEMREAAVAPNAEVSESRESGGSAPIRPAGRGDAH